MVWYAHKQGNQAYICARRLQTMVYTRHQCTMQQHRSAGRPAKGRSKRHESCHCGFISRWLRSHRIGQSATSGMRFGLQRTVGSKSLNLAQSFCRSIPRHQVGGYFSTQQHINPNTQYFYFYAHLSPQDMQQCHAMPELPNFHRVAFRTSHHGIPFLKVALPRVLNMPIEQLLSLSGKSMHPLTFSIRQAGLLKCASGLIHQVWQKYKRRQ